MKYFDSMAKNDDKFSAAAEIFRDETAPTDKRLAAIKYLLSWRDNKNINYDRITQNQTRQIRNRPKRANKGARGHAYSD